MKRYGLIIFMITSMIILLFQAIEYNKLSLKNEEQKEQPKVEKVEEENLKSFKESIDYLEVTIKSINKEKNKYIATVDFEGKFVDFDKYVEKIINNKRIVKDYDIKGDKELLKVNLKIQ